tara:strand:+ start:52602 stop:57530 length:4929 start_codon:yes stop_codon:yes gene_type:complete
MACRVERNNEGQITRANTKYGQESDLYNKLNSVLDDPDIAYAAYLTAANKGASMGLRNEPEFEGGVVQDVVEEVERNYVAWDAIAKELRFTETNRDLADSLQHFFDKANIKVELIDTLKSEDGTPLSAVALADLTNRVVQLGKGSDISALSEEASHFLVEMLRAEDNPLYKSMYDKIETYQEYKRIASPESFYYQKYGGDTDLLKREAIAKVVSKHLVDGNVKSENKSKVSRLQRWFDRVMAWLTKKINVITNDPFTEAALTIVNDNLEQVLRADPSNVLMSGTFYQQDSSKSILDKLREESQNWEEAEVTIADVSDKDLKKYFTKVAGEDLKINRYIGKGIYKGVTLKVRPSDEGSLKYANKSKSKYISDQDQARYDQNAKVRTEMGTKGHKVMEALINKHFNNSRQSLNDIMANGAGSSFTASQLKKLNKSVEYTKRQIKEQQDAINKKNGTKGEATVITEQFVADAKSGVGGTIDLLVVYSDGSASIYDYKFKSPKFGQGKYSTATYGTQGKIEITGDMYAPSLESYDLQLGHYRDILMSKYGVTKIRQSRIIPVSVVYARDKKTGFLKDSVNDLQVFSGEDLDSAYLEHIPVAHEMTESQSINAVLSKEFARFRMLASKLERAKSDEYDSIKSRMSVSRNIIKQLQLNKNVTNGLTEAYRIKNRAEKGMFELEEYITENGKEIPNPKYISDEELRQMYIELKHFQAFTTLPDIVKRLKNSKSKQAAKILEEMTNGTAQIGRTIVNLEQVMLDRMDEKAKNRGIKNFKYNRAGSVMNKFLSAGSVSDPYSRYIHEVNQEMKGAMIKYEKRLAQEIAEKDAILKEYAESQGLTLQDGYEMLINPQNKNLYAKYSPQYYESRNTSFEKNDLIWMQKYHEINEDYYAKEFKNMQARAYQRIQKDFSDNKEKIAKEKAKWNQNYDVKNYKTAWTGVGGKLFLNKNKTAEEFITPEYRKIAQVPALKQYYDFHQEKIKEFGKRYGKNLGATFIPNVHKSLTDSILESGDVLGNMSQSLKDKLQIREHDMSFGLLDLDGSHIREIPRLFVAELRNSKGEVDRNLRSTELGRSLYLLGRASMEYEHKTGVEDELLMIETLLRDTELLKNVKEDTTGGTIKQAFNMVQRNIQKNTNLEKFTDMVDNMLYNRSIKTEDKEFTVFGEKYSRNKTLLALKEFASINALGLRSPVAIGALGAGTMNAYGQAAKGIHFTTDQLNEATKMIVSADPKVRAAMEYYETAVLDVSQRRGEKLASTVRGKYMTSDRWFEMLAQADKLIDSAVTVAMMLNHGVDEQTGKLARLKDLPEGAKSLFDSMTFEENELWGPNSAVDKYKVKIDIDTDKAYNNFRARVSRMGNKIKGTNGAGEINTANMNLLTRFFMHYRSWLPGIAYERFGNLRIDHVMDHWDQGTWKSMWKNIGPDKQFDDFGQIVNTELTIVETLGAVGQDLLKIGLDIATFGMTSSYEIKEARARDEFELHIIDNIENEEYAFEDDEAKEAAFQRFIEMKRGNIRGALAEIRHVVLLAIACAMLGADWDDDGKVDIRQSFAGRKVHNILNRVYREVAVLLDPREMTGPRASGLPILGLANGLIRWSDNTIDEIGDYFFGEDMGGDKVDRFHYSWQFVPGAGALAKFGEFSKQFKYSTY